MKSHRIPLASGYCKAVQSYLYSRQSLSGGRKALLASLKYKKASRAVLWLGMLVGGQQKAGKMPCKELEG